MKPLPAIGDQLRTAREAKGLTLAQVETDTRIRGAFLAALEGEDFAALPGEVYARAFLRNYANYLELDGEALAQRLRQLQAGPVGPELPGRHRRRAPWPAAVTIGLLLAVLAIGVYAVRSFERGPEPPPVLPPIGAVPPVTPSPPDVPPASPPPSLRFTRTEHDARGETIYTVEATELRVQVDLTERCWVEVSVDGQPVLAATQQPGYRQAFTGQRSVVLRLGNLGGAVLRLNDTTLGRAGDTGAVRTIIFRLP